MTKEDKQLLLKDLCARLPYGVKCQTKNGIGTLISIECSFGENLVYVDFGHSEAEEYDLNNGDTVKPYLRPMSSMTAEEENFYYSCLDEMDGYKQTFPVIYQDKALSLLDFLNANHFDYHGLIPMGIALEAPEGMYKTE